MDVTTVVFTQIFLNINTVCQAHELLGLFSISIEGSAKISFIIGYNNNLIET